MVKEALTVAGITLVGIYVLQWIHGGIAAVGGFKPLGITSANWPTILFALIAIYCLLP